MVDPVDGYIFLIFILMKSLSNEEIKKNFLAGDGDDPKKEFPPEPIVKS